MRTIFAIFIIAWMLTAAPVAAQEFTQITNNNVRPQEFVVYKGKLYFNTASDLYLWMYDGYNSPSHQHTTNSPPYHLTVYNNNIYLCASDGVRSKLWKYDGDNAPTPLDEEAYTSPYSLTVYNNKLYFFAFNVLNKLWVYDGYSAPALLDGGYGYPSNLAGYNNKLYFSANNKLWVYNGSGAPTMLETSVVYTDPSNLAVYNDKLYFSADDGTNGKELWMYSGSGDPSMIANINTNEGQGSGPAKLTVFNNKLYFTADDGTYGRELWVYDGTNDPQMVYDINLVEESSPLYLTVLNNKLYFTADDQTGTQIWAYSGSGAPEKLDNGGVFSDPQYLAVFNGDLYFSAKNTSTETVDLWKLKGPGAPVTVQIGALAAPGRNVNEYGIELTFAEDQDQVRVKVDWAQESAYLRLRREYPAPTRETVNDRSRANSIDVTYKNVPTGTFYVIVKHENPGSTVTARDITVAFSECGLPSKVKVCPYYGDPDTPGGPLTHKITVATTIEPTSFITEDPTGAVITHQSGIGSGVWEWTATDTSPAVTTFPGLVEVSWPGTRK